VAEACLRLEGVHTHVGPYHLLQGVDLTVPEGEVTMLLGRNGAGKTTCLRTIMGLWQASQGRIVFDGTLIGGPGARMATPAIARAGIGYVPENMGVFGGLTVRENLVLAARDSHLRDTDRLDWVLTLFPALRRFWRSAAGNLSGGQKQMLALARAMIEPRRLLLIDEPSKGLAPVMVESLLGALRELKAAATTILLVEQNVAVARQLGDTCAVIDSGRIVHAGAMAAFAADGSLQQRLLGLSLAA
jgi:branched-chain amino acid transport system ATP-binding protein